MKVLVFGTGCAACVTMKRNVEQAVEELGFDCSVEQVTQVTDMIDHGVTGTPALKIGGELAVVGRALDVDAIKALLASATEKRGTQP